MNNDEVLATSLADQTRIATIAADVFADLLPHPVEDFRAAGEVDASQLRRVEELGADVARVARDEVDDARRAACRLQHLEGVIAAQNRARCGLPDDGVPHQRG